MKISEKPRKAVLCAAALILSAAAVAGWRVDELMLTDDRAGRIVFSLPAPNGYRFTTGYTHSVELTPVEDEYAVAGGALWNWQERVKSSNAGMPSIAPEHGRYINTEEWLIFQGGRRPSKRFYLRVGNEKFGRNWIELPPYGRAELYKIVPGVRLAIAAEKKPLALISASGLDLLENARKRRPR